MREQVRDQGRLEHIKQNLPPLKLQIEQYLSEMDEQ